MAEDTADTDDHAIDSDDPPIALIAAVADNGVIGDDSEMPWHIPEDLQHFKQTTMGNPVIMGRRTYESIAARIDGPLPGRMNIVLSRSEPDLHESVVVADSIDAAVAEAEAVCELDDDAERIFVIGGATVYEQFLDRADELVLTEIDDAYEGDTEFPEWDDSAWVEVQRDDHDEFSFVTYSRR
ncbi:dihydrofolate reductase [Halonotius terrestris]|uniref:dihydrofolate reductase n=1 Tax=Halonotius terrestris TaxID=2487750 RepID=A0A8J8TD14_9EURY|nr:dihydrofolate reductase [Halonotius terrestris]TQQ82744.1 dihydrofolate reductase [Halonotius terrestris]